ncbi:DEAD/DEAH box helicase [Coraliomargarita algicola]|uniref:DEAD/DEAH box helicase n=1 Tax=Coraliomargarita algicola TaxID=3092156 RepID=A0ABZ0RX80_9BACT|nr:DEAD/DEAH box helicase [Coraliomargarita sp. J2-16]WPJ97624.1 DEAD/DEAH box helicase [Coraliomargarita sp. J2-16]
MALSPKPAPTFDRGFLIELGGGILYRQAEKLFESHAVESAEWESPVLKGLVDGGDGIYTPELNLRSTVFAESSCNCLEGRRRKVCVHVLATALHYQALKEEAKNAKVAETLAAAPEPEPVAAPVKPAKLPRVRSIRMGEDGLLLRVLIFLPPNLEAAAERGAIVLKLDAAAGREILPLNKLNPRQKYKVAPKQVAVLKLVESWCGGKLSSLLQLSGAQLRQLLDAVRGEPIVYWVKKPNAPIDWVDGALPGVYEFLGESAAAEPEPAQPEPVVLDPEPVKPRSFPANLSLREKSKPNLRRIAESKGAKLWQARKADYPVASEAAASMEGFSHKSVVVDGSIHYIAIRLPSGDSASVQPLRSLLKAEGFMLEPSNRKWWLRDRHKVLNFLAGHWAALKNEWQAEFTKNFESKLKSVEVSALQVEAKEDGGKFALEVSLSQHTDEMELRRALASGKNYVEAEDGAITLLDRHSVEQLHQLERSVSGQADRPFTPTFSKRLETQDLIDVEDLLDELCEGWQPPQAWQSRSRALKEVGALEAAPIRPGFDAILRTYQRIGVAWLWHLYRHQLGGILADEMGLGKTLQALALIECIRNEKANGAGATPLAKHPALVVCPASLVENWQRESARFTPNLKTLKHHGPKRAKEPVVLEEYDLVITSYGTLRQDAELLGTMDWCVVIGDEAQHIKNRRSQNAKTLTSLHAEGRFLLTGTPVENSLDDLLSLFSFLMPGYLQKPTGKISQDNKAWHNKRQAERAAAYILRRTKKEVAPELPDKIEKTFFCELGAKQQRFYQDTLEKTRRDIFNLEMSGANAGRVQFAAFTELLRLRQACVDPRIIDEEFPEKDSAKLAAFDEVLDECLDAGSRILVFSSFVTALQLLAEHLEKKGHKFCYLDGKTKNRLALVDEFNQDESIPVFLISLKAGGTGLNLTGADTVLHYDPWWNPAAEAQATDRAHRIGQTKVVTSIKLIAANTVEEKVLELQAKKAEILQELFDESKAANAKVNLDDIKALLK